MKRVVVSVPVTTDSVEIKSSIRRFTDETQRMVEYYFAQGFEAAEIAEKLSLDLAAADRRFNQVLRQYANAADKYDNITARINILKLLKRSLGRRGILETEIDRIQIILRDGGAAEFPNKEIANIRAEDQFIYKIMKDFSGVPKGASDKQEKAAKEGRDVEETRNHLKEVLAPHKIITDTPFDSDPDLESDLTLAMQDDDF